LRLLQGRPRPDRRRARGRAPGTPHLRRRSRRHEHPDAPGGVSGRGHLRPAAARGQRPRPAGDPHRRPPQRALPGPGPAGAGRSAPMTAAAPELVGLPPAPGPIEASGGRRDTARLLVVTPASAVDTTFAALGELLAAGDVLVVNTSATLPAAVPVEGPAFGRGGPTGLLLHLGTELPGGLRLVELRTATGFGSIPFADARPGPVRLPGGGQAELLTPWPAVPGEGPNRLWVARLAVPGEPARWLADHGRP